jgi:creatinine amidohydrolase/Fe(II)-dependent formamide hydrolase-like protein
VSQFLRMDEMTEQGIYGDPTFGSAEKGERMFEAIAGCLADIVRDLQSGKF